MIKTAITNLLTYYYLSIVFDKCEKNYKLRRFLNESGYNDIICAMSLSIEVETV